MDQHDQEAAEMPKDILKRVKPSTLGYAFLAILAFFFVASLVLVYALPRTSAPVKRLVALAPYPVVVVGLRDMITFRELSANMASIKQFYEAQDFSKVGLRVDFSTPEGELRFKLREKEVLNKMLEDRAIKRLAEERGIVISSEMARQSLARKLEEYGTGKEVQANLERLYGWTLQDFEQKVVLPELYKEKLAAFIAKELDGAAAKEKITKAKESLDAKADFSAVAKEFSEGATGEEGGALGWFALTDLAPELQAPVADQAVGTPGAVVESSVGFHIVLVEEVKKEGEQDLYRLKQVFTRKATFADWLTREMRGLSLLVVSPEYRLNREEARIEFRSEEMRTLEGELLEKLQGDAMFLF